jgi:hypothetical protein
MDMVKSLEVFHQSPTGRYSQTQSFSIALTPAANMVALEEGKEANKS